MLGIYIYITRAWNPNRSLFQNVETGVRSHRLRKKSQPCLDTGGGLLFSECFGEGGFEVYDSWFMVEALGFRIQSGGCKVEC